MPDISSRKSHDGATSDNEATETTPFRVHGTDYQAINQSQEPSADRERRASFIEDDAASSELELPVRTKEPKVTWRSLPHKGQLLVIMIARMSEPLVQTSLRVGQYIILASKTDRPS